ncbi:hypothetical protein KQX54_017271 [Cotesia glomerata]|uniref:Uncharacterized protein n=1 Tax=Cotesia glomerata TaxID=32391 RepID=A0AAV7IA75_COTGL|nr:hypothetical protein KQX54_017271 [Cotesia glomerata]
MLSTKTAVVLLVAILKVSYNGSLHPGLASTQVPNIQKDNRQYPVTATPLNDRGDGQPQASNGPNISYGSVTIQKGNTYAADLASNNYYGSITQVDLVPSTSSDSKIGVVPGTTVNEDTVAIPKKNHYEVMSEIAFLKGELEIVKQYLSTLLKSQNALKRDVERVTNLPN